MKLTQQQLEIVKQEHPEWFRPEYKENTWYINQDGQGLQFNVKDGKGYGINANKKWIDTAEWLANYPENGEWIEATKEEIEHALVEEAKKRGFKKGVTSYWHDVDITHRNLRGEFMYHGGRYLCMGDKIIFENGEWAEIIYDSGNDIHSDIQHLKDKYPDYNLTIIAEKK